MLTIQEALKLLNEMASEEEKAKVINVEIIVDTDIDEGLPSGNKDEKYDEQTLEDWYDFASTIEGIIENFSDTVDVMMKVL